MNEHDSAQEWPDVLRLDDEAGPAPFLARAKMEDLIASALDQAGFDMRVSRISANPAARKPGLGMRSLAAAILLACVSVGSASAAVMWFGKREATRVSALVPSGPQVHERAPRATTGLRTRSDAEQAPQLESKPAPKRASSRASEDYLVEGNRLRAERRWARADQAYGRAAREAPNTQTAYVALVASAAVKLEHLQDARGALAHYRAALRQVPAGPLREEIHWGIAEAYRALGERSAEQDALTLFLREHPSSPLVEQARARLD